MNWLIKLLGGIPFDHHWNMAIEQERRIMALQEKLITLTPKMRPIPKPIKVSQE